MALIPNPSPHSGRREFAGFQYLVEHQIDVGHNLIISKSNDVTSKFLELACSLMVLVFLHIVNIPVQFYDQAAFGTVEIRNERTKWVLAPEFQPI